ncbi:MAG: hypothetical protein KKG47_16115 [Proteobacteria bacterium]|nr:hypothetical protein [Pseudomonadota bacterium]MBU1739602.1 hypothetical protein [Pseudomonadota bacterium]
MKKIIPIIVVLLMAILSGNLSAKERLAVMELEGLVGIGVSLLSRW